MLEVYPFASGSLYTASYAVTASWVDTATYIRNVTSASNAASVTNPTTGPRGTSVCLLTYEQYLLMVNSGSVEICDFSNL